MTNALSLFTLLFCDTLGAGAALALALGECMGVRARAVKRTALAALFLFILGGSAAAFSFGRPELIFGVLRNPGTGLFREFASLGGALVLLLLYLVLTGRGALERTTKPAAALSGIAGTLAAVFAALSLYMPWRAGWHTLAMGLPALGWSISAGAAIFLLIADLEARREDFEEEGKNTLREGALRMITFAPLLPAFGLLIFLARLGWGEAPSDAPTAGRLLTGDLALPFWMGALLSGIICPALIARAIRRSVQSKAGKVRGIAAPALLLTVLAALGSAAFSWSVLKLGVPEWRFF